MEEKSPGDAPSGVSIVILNWSRPENVARLVREWQRIPLVSEIIVWNNAARPLGPMPEAVSLITSSRDMSLYTRFAAGALAANEAVLIQDDDLFLPAGTIERLHEAWLRDPEVLHGISGRRLLPDGGYDNTSVRAPAEVPIVLTQGVMTHRRYCGLALMRLQEFEHIQRDGRPYGNGEDILLSYVVRRETGRLNHLHDLPVRKLRSRDGLHNRNWEQHLAHRSRLTRFAEGWLRAARGESGAARRAEGEGTSVPGRALRVAVVSREPLPAAGAGSAVLVRTAAAMGAAGAQVTLVVPRRWRPRHLEEICAFYGVRPTFRLAAVPAPPRLPARGLWLGAAAGLHRAVRRADLVHSDDPLSLAVAQLAGRPWSLEAGPEVSPGGAWLAPLLRRRRIDRAIGAVAHSAADRDRLLSRGLAAEAVITAPPGPDGGGVGPALAWERRALAMLEFFVRRLEDLER